MWDRDAIDSAVNAIKQPATAHPLVETVQEYVRACDHFDHLQAQFRKLNEELKQADTARKELREKLLHMINETAEGPIKARSW